MFYKETAESERESLEEQDEDMIGTAKGLKISKAYQMYNYIDNTELDDENELIMELTDKLFELIKAIAPALTIIEYNRLMILLRSRLSKIVQPTTRQALITDINTATNNKIPPDAIMEIIKVMTAIRLESVGEDYVSGIFNFAARQYRDLPQQYRFTPGTVIGFKSKQKAESLKQQFGTLNINKTAFTTSFPLKRNRKCYQLHKTGARHSYIIDIMFEDRGIIPSSNEKATFCYLLAININTRFLYAQLMNKVINAATNSYGKVNVKSSRSFILAMERFYQQGIIIRHLYGDSEKSFWSPAATGFYDKHNIVDYWPVPRQKKVQYPPFMKTKRKLNDKTEPLHGALAIMDRVIRTLRDMAYNMEVDVITPEIMEMLVSQYNNAPHSTLSKYAGFPVSPAQAHSDIELEDLIVRRIAQENYMIRARPNFYIPNGTKVKVYNEKDTMNKRRSIVQPGDNEVIAFTEGLYVVKNNYNDELQSVPRWKLQPI